MVIALGICLKFKLVELKKITVGAIGVEFQDSRRHILNETALSNINISTQSASIEEPSSQSARIEEPSIQSAVVEEPSVSTIQEIKTSTPDKPVSSRTRSKNFNTR